MNSPSTQNREYEIGDVFQITEIHVRKGWIGCFVMATEIKHFGIQGFVSHIVSHEEQSRAYIRLNWEEIEFIGHAVMILSDETEAKP